MSKCVSDFAMTQWLAALDLLDRAAGKLHDYCAEVNGDMNDSLGTEIEQFLNEKNPGGNNE